MLQHNLNDEFSCDHVNADQSNTLKSKFLNFSEVVQRGQLFELFLSFNKVPEIPAYPTICSEYFLNKNIRVGYEFVTKTITDIHTLKINVAAIEEFYSSSAALKREYGGIKIYSSELIQELQAGRFIYIYWSYGYLRACTEAEAQAFTAHHHELKAFQTKVCEFEDFAFKVAQNEYRVALEEQSKLIDRNIAAKWKGVFIVQNRMLHENNFFGSQKKNTVVHLRLLSDLKKGRVKRTKGELLCGSKAKFSFSDDLSDLKNYVVTCTQCLKMIGE